MCCVPRLDSSQLSRAFRSLPTEDRAALDEEVAEEDEEEEHAGEASNEMAQIDPEKTPQGLGDVKYPVSKANIPKSSTLTNTKAEKWRRCTGSTIAHNDEQIIEPEGCVTGTCERIWGPKRCGERMTGEEKHFHARLNRLLKNAIHLPSPDIIGDVGGTLTRFPVYFSSLMYMQIRCTPIWGAAERCSS